MAAEIPGSQRPGRAREGTDIKNYCRDEGEHLEIGRYESQSDTENKSDNSRGTLKRLCKLFGEK